MTLRIRMLVYTCIIIIYNKSITVSNIHLWCFEVPRYLKPSFYSKKPLAPSPVFFCLWGSIRNLAHGPEVVSLGFGAVYSAIFFGGGYVAMPKE